VVIIDLIDLIVVATIPKLEALILILQSLVLMKVRKVA
jgi:hypothetical protein